jgi:hypothetical protein
MQNESSRKSTQRTLTDLSHARVGDAPGADHHLALLSHLLRGVLRGLGRRFVSRGGSGSGGLDKKDNLNHGTIVTSLVLSLQQCFNINNIDIMKPLEH